MDISRLVIKGSGGPKPWPFVLSHRQACGASVVFPMRDGDVYKEVY